MTKAGDATQAVGKIRLRLDGQTMKSNCQPMGATEWGAETVAVRRAARADNAAGPTSDKTCAVLWHFLKSFKLSEKAQLALTRYLQDCATLPEEEQLALLWDNLESSSNPSWTLMYILDHVKRGGQWCDRPPNPEESPYVQSRAVDKGVSQGISSWSGAAGTSGHEGSWTRPEHASLDECAAYGRQHYTNGENTSKLPREEGTMAAYRTSPQQGVEAALRTSTKRPSSLDYASVDGRNVCGRRSEGELGYGRPSPKPTCAPHLKIKQ